jgi:hypothetical protein
MFWRPGSFGDDGAGTCHATLAGKQLAVGVSVKTLHSQATWIGGVPGLSRSLTEVMAQIWEDFNTVADAPDMSVDAGICRQIRPCSKKWAWAARRIPNRSSRVNTATVTPELFYSGGLPLPHPNSP